MADIRPVKITLRDRQTAGGSIPSDALFGEPFVNLYNGVLRFSGITGGDYENSTQTGVFEVGSTLYNQFISNRLNINNNFIVSGDTGFISTYGGTSGVGLVGKFLSGTSNGFVVADISSIQGVQTYVQPGTNITTGGTIGEPIISVVSSPSFNNLNYSGTSTGGNSIATNVSATTFYSAGTNIETVINSIVSASGPHTLVQPGTNTTTGGTSALPTVNLVSSPSVNGISFSGTGTGNILNAQILTATAITDSNLTSGQAVYASTGGLLKTDSGFTYDDAASTLFTQNIEVGSSSMSGSVTIWGDVLVMGQSISAFTSQLYVEDNNIELNYNPTASTTSTSLGAGWTIQDGDGTASGDVFMDIRGTATGVANRSFSTNLQNIRVGETGTLSSPNGNFLLKVTDILDGGSY